MSNPLHPRAKIAIGIAFVCLATSIWPIYPLLSRIEPRILGIPFSLVAIIAVLLILFSTLVWLFRWEVRNNRLD